MFSEFLRKLKHRLSLPLPGSTAQLRMANAVRRKNLPHIKIPDDARTAAVLILLHEDNFKIKTTLILRPVYDGVHSGQIAFPGGRFETSDAGLSFTALREAEEEIGIIKEDVQIIGKLTEMYIPPSNFLIHPFVGSIGYKPVYIPSPTEVAGIVEVNIDDFSNPSLIREKEIKLSNGLNIITPCYEIAGHTIWGATAMVISEFAVVIDSL